MKHAQTRPKNGLSLFLIVFILMMSTVISTVVLANADTITVDASVVNIRTGPGLSYEVLSQVRQGETFNVIETQNGWHKVRLSNDRIGWVASWLVSNTEVSVASNTVGTVTVNEVNLRDRPTTEADIVGTATQGQELTILSEESGWTQVQYNQNVAWLKSDYIKNSSQSVADAAADDSTVKNVQSITVRSDNTNIRATPSVEGNIISTANSGDVFDFIAVSNDWYEIETKDGQKGYIANWVVDVSETSTPAAVTPVTNLAEATIVIDAGHGGDDPGAESRTGYYEKEITLKTAQAVANRLEQAGANVILTRSDDSTLSLTSRTNISSKNGADLFISIHYDATEAANSVSGTTTYYYSDAQKPIANAVNSQLEATLPLDNLGVRFGDFHVLRENTQPAILLELGYMSSDVDTKTVNNNSYRQKVADSIYNALAEYYK